MNISLTTDEKGTIERILTAESYRNYNKDTNNNSESIENEINLGSYLKTLLSNKRSKTTNGEFNIDDILKKKLIYDNSNNDKIKYDYRLVNDLRFKYDSNINSVTHYKGSCLKFKKM